MKLLKLLFVVLLFSCSDDSKEASETGDPKPIFVEMVANDETNVTGTYILEKNKEYGVREDGKYKILLTKSQYEDKEGKEKEILTYSILDVANNEYLYFTEEIDVAKRLERDWKYYDTYNPEITNKKLICTSSTKEK
ncbi:hypothetical protein [Bacteroides acidifaciens]|uniref:hypothetical protein n=1 Tax=Bacteroides acidifaciens TaxID=85831 RepID=UPI00158BA1C9|nr:hypothetical protein [Bacteroides acidifaciens]